MTNLGDIEVSFEKASITGAITTATSKGIGPVDQEHFDNIGRLAFTYGVTGEKYGVKVSLDAASQWTVGKTSYLTGLKIADGAVVGAPIGSRVAMTVDGAATPLQAGNYTGAIVLTVTAD
jgi:hypothetical protein